MNTFVRFMESSSSDSIILRKIISIQAINKEIIERIEKSRRDFGPFGSHVISGRQLVLDPTTRTTIRMEETKLPCSKIIATWNPKAAPKFNNTSDMNLFNDNLDYTVASFDDLVRLNAKIKDVALKFTWLDPRKSEAVLIQFKDNMEILQTLLGSVESMLISATPDGEDELRHRAEELEGQLKALQADVTAWNEKHAPPHQHEFFPEAPRITTINGNPVPRGGGYCPTCKRPRSFQCSCGKYKCSCGQEW
jgi:hypothetical protein